MRSLFAFAVAIPLTMSQPTPSRADLSVFISEDMEGVAGVVTGEQLGPEARTIRFRADTMPEIARFLQLILNDLPDLAP